MASLNPFGEAKGCIEIEAGKVEKSEEFESILERSGFKKIPLNVQNISSWNEVPVRSYPGILLLPVNWIKISSGATSGYPRLHLKFTDAVYVVRREGKKIIRFCFSLHYDIRRHSSKNKGHEELNLQNAKDLERAFPRFSQREIERHNS